MELEKFDSRDRVNETSLIAQCLPFNNLKHLLERLTAAWCEAFSIDTCGFAWFDDQRMQIASCLRSGGDIQFNSNAPLTLKTPALHDLNSFLGCDRYFELRLNHVAIGIAGVMDEFRIELSDHWIETTACLLQLAQQFERQLFTEKMNSLIEFAAGAGHEINNPLAAIRGRAEQLLKEESDPQRRQLLQTIGAQTYRIRDMIGDTMLFGQPPQPTLRELNLYTVIETVVSRFVEEFQTRRIRLLGNRQREVTICGDETQLSIVVSELVRNALNAVSDGGRVDIECENINLARESLAVLRVRDNGTGLTDLQRKHCFDPFFSGRQAGRGLGFGLSKCWQIVRQHGGSIVCSERADYLTEFVITLPVSAR